MLGQSILKAAGLATLLSNTVSALGCVPRESGQFIQDPSFELEDTEWTYRGAEIGSTPTYPAYSGNKMLVVTASYSKTASGEAVNNYAYIQQFVYPSRTGNRYQIKAHYKVLSHTKGASCPDTSLPLTSCKLRVYYVDQTIDLIDLHPTSGYVELNAPFLPESSGRYLNFNLECKPATTSAGCGEVKILLDDVTWTDPGHVCWAPLGCHSDKTYARALPHHGRLANWPHTTTIESCQQACGAQGYNLAGLEFGCECFCGNELIGSSSKPAAECNMACSGDSRQLCGGPDRLDVYRKP